MIITCNNCNKDFDINSNLIPDNGRLLECGSCKHQWFFKKEILIKTSEKEKIDTFIKSESKYEPKNNKIQYKKDLDDQIEDKNNLDNPIEIKNDLINKQLNPTIEKQKNKKSDKDQAKKSLVKIKNLDKQNKKGSSILNIIIVFIISFTALIIFLDTLKNPISKFIPNIEFLLYSLYESIKDIFLFIKDLS